MDIIEKMHAINYLIATKLDKEFDIEEIYS